MRSIKLNDPLIDRENTLYKTLVERRTIRRTLDKDLPDQVISDILFVASGQTKKASERSKSRRVVPSSCNSQKVQLYCVNQEGIYKYYDHNHSLEVIKNGDYREGMNKQKFFQTPPFMLIYVAQFDGTSGLFKVDDNIEHLLIGTEVGAMAQNVALYCTYNELNNTLIGLHNKEHIKQVLELPDNEQILYTQVVGYPKENIRKTES